MSTLDNLTIAAIVRDTRELYDRQAAEYARSTGDFGLFPGLCDELDHFIERADSTRPLLDLGCGAGRDVEYLTGKGYVTVAADLSAEMLHLTRRRTGGRLPAVQLSMPELPFRAQTFGGVWACASLLHVPHAMLDRVLSEIFRVLAPGGAAAISMKAGSGEGWRSGTSLQERRWFTLVEPEDFAASLRAAGFVRVACTPSGRKNWFVAEGDKP